MCRCVPRNHVCLVATQTKLKTCCTYGYDQASQGHDHQLRIRQLGDKIPFIDSEFSRFGAGLLEAAFAIGDDLYIMSKRHDEDRVVQGQRSKKDHDLWLRDQKENNGKNSANKMHVKTRKAGATNEDHKSVVQFDQQQWPTIAGLVQDEQKRVEEGDGFTTVVITGVDNDLVRQFQQKEMAQDLANAYYYFLEREGTSAASGAAENTRFSRHSQQASLAQKNALPSWLNVTHNNEKPVTLTLQQLDEEPSDLSKIRCFQDDLIEKCTDTKWFFYRCKDPQTVFDDALLLTLSSPV